MEGAGKCPSPRPALGQLAGPLTWFLISFSAGQSSCPRQLLHCHPLLVFPPSCLMASLSLDRLPNQPPAPKSLSHALLLEEPQMGRQQFPL